MKTAVLFSAMGVLAASGSIARAEEIGKVLSSTPVIQQVQVPRQVCSNQVVGGAPPSGGGAVVGGLTGGLLGNAISTGSGSGKAAATALGIVGGALLGNSIEASNNAPRNVQRCTTQTFLENRTIAYNVRYEYAGREYDVQMPYDPGPTIRLQVTPVAGNSQPGYGSSSQQPDGVITAPPVQGNGNGNGNGQTPIAPVYSPSDTAQQPPAYPVSPQVRNTQIPSYLQSPDGYPPPPGGEVSTTYYPSYPYASYYGSYPYYYGYPYYGSYWPYFPVALSLGFGYWAGGGGHGYHGGYHGGGRGGWGGGGHGGGGGAGRGAGGGGGRR